MLMIGRNSECFQYTRTSEYALFIQKMIDCDPVLAVKEFTSRISCSIRSSIQLSVTSCLTTILFQQRVEV